MQTRSSGLTVDYITRTFVREPEYIAHARAEGERVATAFVGATVLSFVLFWRAWRRHA